MLTSSGVSMMLGATYSVLDSPTTFSNATRAFRACMPRAPLLSLASLSRRNSFFWRRSCLSRLSARIGACGSDASTPSERALELSANRSRVYIRKPYQIIPLISCSTAFLAVARSTTSCRTVGPRWSLLPGLVSLGASSVSLVCCRSETLVSSGIPGISFSAIALSSAAGIDR